MIAGMSDGMMTECLTASREDNKPNEWVHEDARLHTGAGRDPTKTDGQAWIELTSCLLGVDTVEVKAETRWISSPVRYCSSCDNRNR